MAFGIKHRRDISGPGENSRFAAVALRVAVLFFTLCATGAQAHAGSGTPILDVETAYSHDNNLSRADEKYSQRSGALVTTKITWGGRYQLGLADRANLTINAAHIYSPTYGRLGGYSAGADAAIMHKFGVGPFRPWAKAYTSAQFINVRDNSRDAMLFVAGFQAGGMLPHGIEVSLGTSYKNNDAHNKTFNSNGYTTSLQAGFPLWRNIRLNAGYGVYNGDVTIYEDEDYTPPAGAQWMMSDTFGGDEDMLAYRVHAKTSLKDIALVFPAAGGVTVTAGLQRQDTKAAGIRYPNNVWRLTVNYKIH